jgi:hypothetical protein
METAIAVMMFLVLMAALFAGVAAYGVSVAVDLLRMVHKRLHEIEDTRPVNKINIVGDVSVPKGQAFALNINESSTIGTGWIKP